MRVQSRLGEGSVFELILPSASGPVVVAGDGAGQLREATPTPIRDPRRARDPSMTAIGSDRKAWHDPFDLRAHRGGRGLLHRRADPRADPRGLPGERGPRRGRGPGAVRRREPRPGAPRRHAAQDLRPRRVPRAAGPLQRADHHGHGQGGRDRHRRGARGGSRRLRHQALPPAGAGGPHPGGAAPPVPRRGARAGAGPELGRGRGRGGRRARRPRAPRGVHPRTTR